MARHRTIVDAELLGGGAPVAGRLDVTGGGVAFLPRVASGGFLITPHALRSVGPARPPGAPSIRMEAPQELAVEGDGVRHVLRVDPEDASGFVAALRRARQEAGAAEIPLDAPLDGVGDGDLRARGPSAAEQLGLPGDSLPARWLALTRGANRVRTRHIDGMAMLIELALLGAIDAPARDRLVVGWRPLRPPALAGALARLDGRDVPAHPPGAASWLGPYVARLATDGTEADTVRAETREALLDGPSDPRGALLVWLVKQDYAQGRVVPPLLFGEGVRRGARCIRRSRPSLHVGDDREATMRGHRVLAATIVQPMAGPG